MAAPDAAAVASEPSTAKEFETLRAKYALLGFALHALEDGTYLAARWNQSRVLATLAAVQSFLILVGAKS